MLLPVIRCDVGILDGISAMNHHVVAQIDADMGSSRGIVSALKENEVAGLALDGDT